MLEYWLTSSHRKLLPEELPLLHHPDERGRGAGPVQARHGRGEQEEYRHRHLRLQRCGHAPELCPRHHHGAGQWLLFKQQL